jgi:protein gp37
MSQTTIEWCDYVFNPWQGCAKVSAGCEHCYAEAMGRRFGVEWGPQAKRQIKMDEAFWDKPLHWNRLAQKKGERRRVFALSMGDWLEDRVELIDPLARLLRTIYLTPFLDWIMVTKRPELWRQRMEPVAGLALTSSCWLNGGADVAIRWLEGRPPANAWILASVEDQEAADRRIPDLLRIPAVKYGLSCEPLLGPIDLRVEECWIAEDHYCLGERLSWVIAGGESGPGARPCNFAWLRSLRDQCQEAKIPFFLKQVGSNPHGEWLHGEPPTYCLSAMTPFGLVNSTKISRCKNGRWKLGASKGNWPGEWPEDLRVREVPK